MTSHAWLGGNAWLDLGRKHGYSARSVSKRNKIWHYLMCQENMLTITTTKTKHMFVGRQKEHTELASKTNVYVNEKALNNVSRYTYLGVDIDNTTQWWIVSIRKITVNCTL